jgi:integrase
MGAPVALVDCNNFYASCERVFQPRLRGKPVVVLSNNDGCVIARSNKAKALGVEMGAPWHLSKENFRKAGIVVRTNNPMPGVKRDGDKVRKVALDERQYMALGAILTSRGLAWQAVAGILLLAMTGSRRSEIEDLTRVAVHAPSRALSLVDSKTGASVRPVGAPVIALVTALAPLARNGFVLPSARNAVGRYGGLPRAWDTNRSAEPLLRGVTLRDLRRSFASVADELDLTIPTIAALLGHSGSSITQRYIVKPDPAIQSVADRWRERSCGEWG